MNTFTVEIPKLINRRHSLLESLNDNHRSERVQRGAGIQVFAVHVNVLLSLNSLKVTFEIFHS